MKEVNTSSDEFDSSSHLSNGRSGGERFDDQDQPGRAGPLSLGNPNRRNFMPGGMGGVAALSRDRFVVRSVTTSSRQYPSKQQSGGSSTNGPNVNSRSGQVLGRKKTQDQERDFLPDRAYALLPSFLKQAADCFEDRRRRDVFLTGAFAVCAGALPNVRVWYGRKEHSVNLYFGVVAPPASGKGDMGLFRDSAEELDKELRADSRQARRRWEQMKNPSGPKPPERRFFLAGDSSKAKFAELLEGNPHGVIFETEFLTLRDSLSQGWGLSSDQLLRGFQNETMNVERKSGEPTCIPHPAPSVAISGTPGTFRKVISTTEDGLFSRFMFYRFEKELEWIPQFQKAEDRKLKTALEEAGETLQDLFYRLEDRPEPLKVRLLPFAEEMHNEVFTFLTEEWKKESPPQALRPSLTRAGLQSVRIAAILSVLRQVEHGLSPAGRRSVSVGPADMEAGLRLTLTYLLHALRVGSDLLGEEDPKEALASDRRRFYDALPTGRFNTDDAKNLADQMQPSRRTAQRWLKKFVEMGLLVKRQHGTWEKPAPDLGGIPGMTATLSALDEIPLTCSLL